MSILSLSPARTLIGAFTAAAIGLGTLIAAPAPARADNWDTGRVIAGAVALGIVGAAIHDSKKDRKEAERRREAEHRWNDRHDNRKAKRMPQGQNCVRTRGGDIECGAPLRRGNGWHNDRNRNGWHNNARGDHRERRQHGGWDRGDRFGASQR